MLKSATGVQQGDPLGPALFSLAIHAVLKSLKSCFNVWYLDDGSIGGEVSEVTEDLKSIIEVAPRLGLELNLSKCEIILGKMDGVSSVTALSELKSVSPDLRLVQFEEATLLGAPLFIKALPSALDVKIGALKRLTSNLDFLHAHDALFLLKNCLAIPMLLHVLRCSPTWKANDQLLAFDEVLRRTLESVCNIKMDGAVWSQATLPTSKGGLGIRRSQDLALPAFMSSTYVSSDLVRSLLPANEVDGTTNLTTGMDLWRKRSGKPLPSEELPILHRVWDEAYHLRNFLFFSVYGMKPS